MDDMMSAEVLELVPLRDEPWGRRLARAREQAGLTLEQAAMLMDELSKSTLGRLEKKPIPPTSQKDRRKVAMACVLYGIDPSDLGVSLADIPPYVDQKGLRTLGLHGVDVRGALYSWSRTHAA